MLFEVLIDNRSGQDLPIERIEELAGFVLAREGFSVPLELSISFVGLEEITELNERYRGKPTPTDVLSFGLDDSRLANRGGGGGAAGEVASAGGGDGGGASTSTPLGAPQDIPQDIPLGAPLGAPTPQDPLMLGDIVINPDVARDHAKIEELTLEEEFWVLVIHGILHLLGHDHENPSEAQAMEEREDEHFSQWEYHLKGEKPQVIPEGIQDHRGLRGLGATFRYALQGFAHTVKTQRSMRIHLVAMVLVTVAGLLARLNLIEWAIITICVGLVLASELINTALEAIVDIAAPTFHPKAKIAKDAAAAAVFVFAVVSVIVGSFVFVVALERLLG